MASLCLRSQQILEDVHNKAEIKGNKKIEFENPPSGKLVGGVKETKGNGWAVTITESPEVNPLSHSIVHTYK